MKVTVIGIGAGGNKAAIALIENGVIDSEHVKLLNTTLKDIPENYKDLGVTFASTLGGCGQERKEGAKSLTNAVRAGSIDLLRLVNEDTKEIILVTSTEGGTGSGATPLIAKYFLAANLPVHVFGLVGFNDTARATKNTLSFFSELEDDVILHTIRNSEFLDYSENLSKAEESANMKFVSDVRAIIGSFMIPSAQNIDEKDMYKITSTPQYMDIEYISLTGVKNQDLFNKAVQQVYDNVSCLEFDKSAKRMGVIINASEKTVDAIDHKFEVIKRFIGEPYEIFRHIQYDDSMEEFMYVFSCGMNFPEEGIRNLNKIYQDMTEKVNKSSSSLSDIFSGIDIDEDDDFDMGVKKLAKPNIADIFGGAENKNKKKDTNINSVVEVKKKQQLNNNSIKNY